MAAAILSAAFGNLVVAAALAAAAFVAGRRAKWHAAARGAWLLVLVKLLTPPLVTVPVRCFPPRPPAAAVAPEATAPAVVSAQPPSSPQVFAGGWHALRLGEGRDKPAKTITPFADSGRATPHWTTLLLGVWLTGSGAWAAVAALRVRRFTRLLRFASAAPPALT